MAEPRERRRRDPKRPIAYLIIVAVCAVTAIAAAWDAAQPHRKITVVWRGKPQFVSQRKAQDARTTAP